MSDQIPKGYRQNGQGHLVPEANISDIDLLRDELVVGLVKDAKERSEAMSAFKRSCHSKVSSFVEVAAQDHNVSMGGNKGNVALTSFDGRFRVIRAIDETIQFTEGLVVAREMIERCIKRWSDGSNANLVVLIRKAFETDRQGNLSTARVLGLASVKIDDPEWREAVDVIQQSVRVASTKAYIRFYERNALGKYVQIPLDGE
jgi:ATP/maltotriose-dependent transcriptional regulator MalT